MNRNTLTVLALACALTLAGCASKTLEGKKIDYKSAGQGKALNVPPDLSVPPSSDRYNVPEPGSGTATYSEYSENQAGAKPGEPSNAAVLPVRQAEEFHVERAGTQRWLVARGEPDALWPVIREFWQDSGFLIDRESPDIGIMETDWAENRAKIPDSTIRKLIGKVLDQAYSYPERDRFRTRLERGKEPGTTEIYVSHRGAYQVVVGERSNEQVKWQMRPTDPELEAEMLYRLMARLGGKQEQVEAQRKAPAEPRAELTRKGDTPESLLLRDSFDRAWRRVGLALDRVGFTVEDRDRSRGLYYVRYVDPDSVDEKSESFLSRLAFWRGSDAAKKQEQFRISVADSDKGSEVKVLNADGQKANTPSAGRILSLLQAELK
jgi:outer membrane protein assembly factor BamC